MSMVQTMIESAHERLDREAKQDPFIAVRSLENARTHLASLIQAMDARPLICADEDGHINFDWVIGAKTIAIEFTADGEFTIHEVWSGPFRYRTRIMQSLDIEQLSALTNMQEKAR